VCVSVHLLLEYMHVGLTYVAGRWAWSPLAVIMTSVAGEWFTTLSTLRTIPGMVYERPSLHLFGGINSRVPGVGSLTLVLHDLL
jgi:hypothetical protein